MKVSKSTVFTKGDLHSSNDKSAKRLVDCVNKILHGELEQDNVHLWKSEALKRICSGLEFPSLLKPSQESRCSMTSPIKPSITALPSTVNGIEAVRHAWIHREDVFRNQPNATYRSPRLMTLPAMSRLRISAAAINLEGSPVTISTKLMTR